MQSAPIYIPCKSDERVWPKGRDFHQTRVSDSEDLVPECSHSLKLLDGCSALIILVLKERFPLLGNKNLLGVDEMWSKLIEHYENNHCLVDESWPWTK